MNRPSDVIHRRTMNRFVKWPPLDYEYVEAKHEELMNYMDEFQKLNPKLNYPKN